jgi:hypothetical protein
MRSFALVLLFACGHPAGHDPKPTPRPMASDPTCPLEIAGTSVTVEDTDDGGALVFATTGDAAAVQARALAFEHAHGKSDAPAFAAMVAPAATVSSAKIDTGAKLVFKAAKPDGIADLQSELRMHAGHLSAGSCLMAM